MMYTSKENRADMQIIGIKQLNDTLTRKAMGEMYSELFKNGVISRQQYIERMHDIIDFEEEL